jgi:site-specific DNA-adenine methylase
MIRIQDLTNLDYRELDIPRNSFAFLDPPYENKKLTFNYEHGIDLTEFRDWADDLPGSWLITINDSSATNALFSRYDRIVYEYRRTFPVVLHTQAGELNRATGSEIIVMNYHRPTRDAFLKSFSWSLRKAHPASKAC